MRTKCSNNNRSNKIFVSILVFVLCVNSHSSCSVQRMSIQDVSAFIRPPFLSLCAWLAAVLQRMVAHSQYCQSGDHTLEATALAVQRMAGVGPQALEVCHIHMCMYV
jgi:hypothetical protein